MTATRAALIIPARNEELAIGDTVAEARLYFAGDIVVVDNGSSDSTAPVARRAGATVVLEPEAGYGRACTAGAVAARGVDVLVFMDGDGSDMPQYIPALIAAVEDGADVALGVRRGPGVEPGSMTAAARFGNWLSSVLFGLRYGRRLHDLSPLKAVRRVHFEAIPHRELTYGWTVELLARSLQVGARIDEVTVGYRRRRAGQSKVSGNLGGAVRAGVRILLTIGRVGLSPWTSARTGAVAGIAIAVIALAVFGMWLAAAEASTWRAGVAVWLVAWPVLLIGTLGGYVLGALAGRLMRRALRPARGNARVR